MKKIVYIAAFFWGVDNTAHAQCPVVAPPDMTVNCGTPVTVTAGTNFVTYTVISYACSYIPLTNPTTAFPNACDDCVTGQVNIGFPFNFFGNTYTTAVIQSNGIIGFGNFTYTGYSSFAIPTSGQPNNYIAGLYADIDIRCGAGSITYQTIGTAPNRQFIVSYDNVQAYGCYPNGGNGATATFQIILNEDGTFYTVIQHVDPGWSASTSGTLGTQGVENIDGSIAFTTPGRNSTSFTNWDITSNDCQSYVSSPCNFMGWYEDTALVTATPALSVTPSYSTTYIAKWNCVGTNSICSDSTRITIGGMPIPTHVTHCKNEPSQSLAVTASCGTIQWFASDTSTTPIGTGNSFNPVGVAGSGLANTANSGVWTYYAACQNAPNCRTPVNYQINAGPATADTAICQNKQSVSLIAVATCPPSDLVIAQNTTFNSGALTTSDPTWTRTSANSSCSPYIVTGYYYYYDVFTFTVSCSGTYTFNSCFPSTDGFAVLYKNAFDPTNCCAIPSNYVTANDDGNGSSCSLAPRITANLVTGVTYYLVSTSFGSGGTSSYSWTYTGPSGCTIIQPNAGPPGNLQWYTAFSGGSPIVTSSTLDPVSTTGSGLTNTATPGTYSYFVSCSNTPTCRSQANFVINPSPRYTDTHVVCDSFTWVDGITYTESTDTPTYTYTIAGGCDSVLVLNLTVYNTPIAEITGISPICSGTTTTLTASGAGSYLWNTSATSGTITAGIGSYTLVVDTGICSDTTTFVVDTFALPVPVISGIMTVCVGETATLVASGADSTYRWSDGTSSDTLLPTTPGTYSVIATNTIGCSASTSAQVSNFVMPIAATTETDVLCFGDNTGTVTVIPDSSSGYAFAWSPNVSTSATATGLGAGDYSITVTDLHNCTVTTSATVNQPPLLEMTFDNDSVRCYGEHNGIVRAIGTGGVLPYSYLLDYNGISSTGVFENIGAGSYTVQITDSNGCVLILPTDIYQPDSFVVTVDPVVDSFILALGEKRIATISSNHPNATYTWTPVYGVACPTCGSTVLGGYQNADYTILIADGPCTTTAEFHVTVNPNYNIYLPNVFTPNDNNVNDIYEVFGNKETWKELSFEVFNRWGEKVYQTHDVDFQWDGRYRGAYLNPGIYPYIFKLDFIDGHISNIQGTLTILR